ncbi:hypothetical protein OAT86_01165 [Planktomarina sp.]|nr:hypothetical protein [Planktomarina temperata]MDC3221852.1 hypothetical protein [Planktomarina sp.]
MSRSDSDISAEDTTDALLALSRLLGRIAAQDAVDQSLLGTPPPQSQQKGACDDE